jgi:NTP pyrophosphatase (non-canonical NTP hydrolase)
MNNDTQETLLILMEECSEVTQAVSKCLRFGLNNVKPGKAKTNVDHLEEELGDLLCMIQLLEDTGVVDTTTLLAAKQAKLEKLKCWSSITAAK